MASISEVAAAHRAALARGERDAFERMLEAYGRAWQNIALELDRLTSQITAAQAAGEVVSPAWLYRERRLTNLRAAIEREITRFARVAGEETIAAQAAAVAAATADATGLMAASSRTVGLATDFEVPSTAALDALVGNLAPRSPLTRLLAGLPDDAGARAEAALVRGVSRGIGPRAIARDMRHALGGNLARALTIARTETLRAYREAARLTYEANGDVLEGWRWTCARQLRTCAMCWAMDGTIHPVTATLDSHPNCRCAMVPVVIGGVVEHPPPAEDAFADLPESAQLAVLGRSKLAAYRSGQIRLRDLVGRTDSRAWGTTRHELSLADALEHRGRGTKWRMGQAKHPPKRHVPEAAERAAMRDVAPYRTMARREAGRVVDDADAILERLEGGRLRTPPPRRQVFDRLRGRQSRADAGGEWDWFYALNDAEQKRLRRHWAAGDPATAMGPDQLAEIIADRLGITDHEDAMRYWLDLTRRHEAAKAVQVGRMPSAAAYGDFDVDQLLPEFSDEGFKLRRLFDSDAAAAARHVAEVNDSMAGLEAARMLPKVRHGEKPWRMDVDDYERELDDTLDRIARIEPTGADEFGPTYSRADAETLARYDELWPADLEEAGESLEPSEMHGRMVELASRAGLT